MDYTVRDKEILFPEAKINLGLLVTRRRADGYHILQTLFYPIDWRDALEITSGETVTDTNAVQTEDCRVTWVQTGIQVNCNPEQNLCVKAYRLLQEQFPDLPAVTMHLEKQIPFGAGLGGGSSDGSHALVMLRRMFDLPVSDAELEAMAARMGADCAFFCRCGGHNLDDRNAPLKPVAQYCEGVGHEMEPYALSLKGRHIVIVKPPFGVSTREAYSGVRPRQPETPLYELLRQPIERWKECIHNDFEDSVFPLHPELKQVKDLLYAHGAVYASMSGSGSALFGIFEQEQPECQQWFDDGYVARCTQTLL